MAGAQSPGVGGTFLPAEDRDVMSYFPRRFRPNFVPFVDALLAFFGAAPELAPAGRIRTYRNPWTPARPRPKRSSWRLAGSPRPKLTCDLLRRLNIAARRPVAPC